MTKADAEIRQYDEVNEHLVKLIQKELNKSTGAARLLVVRKNNDKITQHRFWMNKQGYESTDKRGKTYYHYCQKMPWYDFVDIRVGYEDIYDARSIDFWTHQTAKNNQALNKAIKKIGITTPDDARVRFMYQDCRTVNGPTFIGQVFKQRHKAYKERPKGPDAFVPLLKEVLGEFEYNTEYGGGISFGGGLLYASLSTNNGELSSAPTPAMAGMGLADMGKDMTFAEFKKSGKAYLAKITERYTKIFDQKVADTNILVDKLSRAKHLLGIK